jgi:hypothetical protein
VAVVKYVGSFNWGPLASGGGSDEGGIIFGFAAWRGVTVAVA